MQRYVIVDTTSNQIVNLVEYEDQPSSPPPGFDDGIVAIQHDTADSNWAYDGEKLVEPVVTVVPFVPSSASKLGLKRAFDELGMWAQVKAALAANADAQEEWDLAIEIKRTDTIVQGFIAAFSLTDEQVDQLLIRAQALVS